MDTDRMDGAAGTENPVPSAVEKIEEEDGVDIDGEMAKRANGYRDIYVEAKARGDALSEGDIEAMVERLRPFGDPAVAPHCDMIYHETFERFLQQAAEGVNGEGVYYSVNSRGNLTRTHLLAQGAVLYGTASSIGWDDAMHPTAATTEHFVAEKWRYTEKGYFVYETNDPLLPYSMLRVRPLGEDNRTLWNRYIRPIGYHGNNFFLVDWDQSDLTGWALNDLYEYLYAMEYGRPLELDDSVQSIEGDAFAPLYAKYLGAEEESLRRLAIYEEREDAYFWNALSCRHYNLMPIPEAEVVDSWQNEDGSLTMVVDAVEASQGTDRLFTHEVTVRVRDDGSFQYLSNALRVEDENRVPRYTPRSQPYY